MKKIVLFCLTAVFLFVFCSCSQKNQENASGIAQNMLQKMYTVVSSTLKDYSDFINSADNTANQDKLFGKFKTDLTEDEYNALIKNAYYTRILQSAQKGESTFECKKVNLQNATQSGDSAQFDYQAEVTVTDKANKQKTEMGSGSIQLTKVKDDWKVSWIRVSSKDALLQQ